MTSSPSSPWTDSGGDSAPLDAVAAHAASPPAVGDSPSPSLAPLNAPTQFPDEPVTAGAPLGAGPGPEGLAAVPQAGVLSARLRQLAMSDTTGELNDLLYWAERRNL